ncbi:MAG: hypothetical protein ACLUKN_08450 [Bacilli bacterium]
MQRILATFGLVQNCPAAGNYFKIPIRLVEANVRWEKGIFKPNTQYKISLSYKISSPSKTLLMLVREDGDTKAFAI